MKLLVVSHACVTAINQSFFLDVEAATNWKITLVVPSSWKTDYRDAMRPEQWPGLHAAIYKLPVMLSGNIPLHFYKNWFVGLLRREQPDAIYVHHEPYGLATFQLYLANAITGNKPIGFYAAQNILKQHPFPFGLMERWVFNRSSFAFPVTEGALAALRQKGYQGNATVLPLAIDANIYKPEKEWASAKRAELGIAPDEFIIGYLGRLVEEKGLVTLLHSLRSLNFQRWQCVLVGAGPCEPLLRHLVDKLRLGDRVKFIGYIPHQQAPRWLSLFDVLALPSETRPHWKEQFGRVLLEALACGTPVVGSDSGEIPAVLNKTGGGLIFSEGNAEALAVCLDRLQDPAQRNPLVAQGQAAILKDYQQKHLAAKFASVIESTFRAGEAPAFVRRTI